MANTNIGGYRILLRNGRHTEVSEEFNSFIVGKGEVVIEYQDQHKGKWYRRFLNTTRFKIGDGKTAYKDLPFINGIFNPAAELLFGIISISWIWIMIFIMFIILHIM